MDNELPFSLGLLRIKSTQEMIGDVLILLGDVVVK